GPLSQESIGQIPRGQRNLKIVRRRVLEIQAEHQERGRIGLGPPYDQYSRRASLVADRAPGDRLVAIEPDQGAELVLDRLGVERCEAAAREESLEPSRVGSIEPLETDEGRGGQLAAAPA